VDGVTGSTSASYARRVADLDRYLRYLERDDVVELVLQTGKVAALRLVDGRMHPLTKQSLASGHVVALLDGVGLRSLLPSRDTAGEEHDVEIEGVAFRCRVGRHGDQLQVRVTSGAAAAPAEPTPPSVAPPSTSLGSAKASLGSGKTGLFGGRAPVMTWTRGSGEQRVHALLREARESGCSDVHLVGGMPARLRRLGELLPIGEPIPETGAKQMLECLLAQAGPRPREQLEQLGYTDFALEFEQIGRLRVNFARGRSGLKGCFRLVVERPPTLAELGLPQELGKVASYHQGLAIVSGPSGQGKTTTMAALVDLVNESKPHHIITVEDPIEVVHPVKRAVISQRQVGLHTESFHRALKAALREDPDVIVIGELRDRETVEMALQAAETGHLVIASMSTPSGAKTIDRLIDMFPPEDQQQVRATMAGALKIVVSQRLVPAADRSRLVAAAELITGSVPLWSLIRENKLFQLPSLLQRGRNYGMIRVEDSLDELLAAGTIDLETARAHADEPKLIGRSIGAAPVGSNVSGTGTPVSGTAPSGPAGGALGAVRNLFGRSNKPEGT
jgi:twitching motility protein PilT